jgi:LysR family transcriptional regulator, low CO2-responsive transcriptional regulator
MRPLQRSSLEERVTLHQLRTFKTVADTGSFSRAAEQLHLSQPAVSHQVKALSLAIGSPLFEEIGRRINPTETGRLLYLHASLILTEVETAGRALDEHQGLRQGEIRLVGDSTVGIYVLPDLLAAFKDAYPDVTPHLDIGNQEHVYERLMHNDSDFAVIGDGWLRRDLPLVVEPFLPNDLIAIAAREHPLAGAGQVPLARFAEEPLILREPGSETRETVDEALAGTGCRAHVAMELPSSGAIKRAVARGFGVSILPRCAVSLELRLESLVEIPIEGFPIREHWHLVYPQRRRFGPVSEAFRAFVRDGTWRIAGEILPTGG